MEWTYVTFFLGFNSFQRVNRLELMSDSYFLKRKQANLSLSVCQQRLAQAAIFNAAFNVSASLPRGKINTTVDIFSLVWGFWESSFVNTNNPSSLGFTGMTHLKPGKINVKSFLLGYLDFVFMIVWVPLYAFYTECLRIFWKPCPYFEGPGFFQKTRKKSGFLLLNIVLLAYLKILWDRKQLETARA